MTKALWIRVEAHAVDSVEIARLAELLELDVVTAFGHYCALGGAIAEHSPDGDIAGVPNAAIERWGRWPGKRGRFAAAVRDVFQDQDGTFGDWLESMGKLIERREKERARKLRGPSAEPPRHFPGDSGATERNGTERKKDLESERSHRRSGVSDESTVSAPVSASAPPADASFAEVGKKFLATFYGRATVKRIADVRRQLSATLTSAGAVLKGQRIRAGSEARLVAKMREVIAEGVNDDDKAIVVLLLKLGDTTDGSAPGAIAAVTDAQSAQRTEAETARELVDAYAWLDLNPETEARIDTQLERDGFDLLTTDETLAPVARIAKNAKVLDAWRRDRPPNAEPARASPEASPHATG